MIKVIYSIYRDPEGPNVLKQNLKYNNCTPAKKH